MQLKFGAILYYFFIKIQVYSEKTGFRFARNYGSNMVLQRGPLQSILWGFGENNQTVIITIMKDDLKIYFFETITGFPRNGIWKKKLPPITEIGPYHIIATSKWKGQNVSAILDNVLFGDVWFCSGQSNMGFTVGMSYTASEEFALADNYPHIRLFTMYNNYSDAPVTDLPPQGILQPWSIASKAAISGQAWSYFSALCWMYGRRLYDLYQIPIGLIASKYGGTPAEAWSSPDSLAKCGLDNQQDRYRNEQSYSALWNAMVYPHINTTIKGVIWYQGERNNLVNPNLYACVFPEMIIDWREKWFAGTDGSTNTTFPFGFVQLAPIGDDLVKYRPVYPKIRWEQTANYGYVPNPRQINVFMAVAMDLPDDKSPYGSIHPRDKSTIADRLVLGARAMVYGEDVNFQGPILDNCELMKNLGGQFAARITYRGVRREGIALSSLNGFEVFTTDSKEWIPLEITQLSENKQTILLSLPANKNISAIRYAWNHRPCDYRTCAVYSVENKLPSPPSICFIP